jgi:hypothetical protein
MRKEASVFRVTARDLKVGDNLIGEKSEVLEVVTKEAFYNDRIHMEQVEVRFINASGDPSGIRIFNSDASVVVVE